MIKFNQFQLPNGLQVIVHEDPNTQLAIVNTLYDVGSRDEDPELTGFAHLFEHLMFGGSANIDSFDGPIQEIGGESNAFTSSDITNYYVTVPAVNVETAFWLESDRMNALSFDPNVLEVQRKVVIEEFKQRYLSQPFGDASLKLKPLAFQEHPYSWPTIGKDIGHIERASMDQVKEFYQQHYGPDNAIMVVAGNVKTSTIEELCHKWYADIEPVNGNQRLLPKEPKQVAQRTKKHFNDVPSNALYLGFHMGGRNSPDYYAIDLLSDILGRGNTSRLYKKLVEDKKLFTTINAYIDASIDPGLFHISGILKPEVTPEHAEEEVFRTIRDMAKNGINSDELKRVKRQAETAYAFGEISLQNRATSLAYSKLLGDPNLVNDELRLISSVELEDINSQVKEILRPKNCSSLYYYSNKN